ncbi:sensor histidine kinase [Xanthomonas maliensis]|uniref:sensor histidine kinase n=1 Tax=Xanthomonas maliensis TaxID=1321368 RepID=UPI00039B8CE9|nr:two-component regulator propeller domain-containing protein [Xanthomonas maliensis]KAB7764323.1 ATPase [Xanthomonas maliensis]
MSTRRASRRRSLQLALLWLLLCCCLPVFAQLADYPLSQLHHMRWTVQNGAPSGMVALAQTRDGYIWVVGNGGLFRFDGVEFERIRQVGGIQLPVAQVYGLWARPGGGLWVNYLFGGLSFIGEDGSLHNYSSAEGLPPNTVMSFAEDAAGIMWVGTTRGLYRLHGRRWILAEDNWQATTPGVYELELDRDGTLWAYTNESIHFKRRGEQGFQSGLKIAGEMTWGNLLKAPDGRVWLLHQRLGLTELRTPRSRSTLALEWRQIFEPRSELAELMIDRDWNLWHSAAGGLTRTPIKAAGSAAVPAVMQENLAPDPIRLLGETPRMVMQDREGNVWAVSDGGLSRFRASAFVRVGLEHASRGAGMATATDGSIWVSDSEHGLHRLQNGFKQESFHFPHEDYSVLHRDHAGALWFGGRTSSIYRRSGTTRVEWRPKDTRGGGGIQAIVSQPDGTLWVSVIRVGVYRVVDNHWTLWGGLAGLPREPATSMTLDTAGRLWLGYVRDRIVLVDGDRVSVYGAADGLVAGAVQVIAVSGRNLWVGGEKGLARFDGTRFHPVLSSEGNPFGSVTGLIERAGGELWLNTSDGAVLIDADQARRVAAEPEHRVRFRLFDHQDGFPGSAQLLGPWPTAVESSDGRLWFSTSNGVVTLAPRLLPRNTVVPPVYIKSITVDGKRIGDDANTRSVLQLPSTPKVMQIAYTAPSFTMPERVRFRYRLEGSQMGWEDVGTRREAFFTGLPPGNYRFQVVAANESGVWNGTGASLAFVVPPTFVQSRAFLVLCAAAVLGAFGLLFVLRMRQIKAKLQWRSEARLLERERIARDLHDTFLQGVQGLMLRFQSAAERIPEGERARELMEEALDRADRILADGRDKVAELRTSICLDLPEALAMSGNELSRDYGVAFQALVEGNRRELDPLVVEEAFHIGAEALANAFRHACATHISVVTVFARRQLEVRVNDDGSGFDLSGVRDGRWGLKGLYERAARIRGKLLVASRRGVGTMVQLQLPAKWAYKRPRKRLWDWRRAFDIGEKPT